MKLNKIALSAIMAMSVFTGVPAVTSVSAAEDLVYDSDLSDNGTAVPQAWGRDADTGAVSLSEGRACWFCPLRTEHLQQY